ncbi:MAG TPA: condensation domain-containing protein [Kofleriaceae bacterium]|jgi:hypothetical protein|nr:condensation domain-containing protein [Kofleriaceae bacterium]
MTPNLRPFRQFRKFAVERTNLTSTRARPPQEYFWYMVQHDPDPTAYYSPAALVIEGPLDVTLLKSALGAFFADHSVYRTALTETDGVLQQVVLDVADPRSELEVIELPLLPEAEWAAELTRSVEELVARDFDLARGHVLWSRLIHISPERNLLVFVAHHAAIDASSFGQLLPWLFAQYERMRAGTALLPRPLQYLDFSEALQRWQDTPDGVAAAAYWKKQLHDAPPVEIPCDLPRADVDREREAAPLSIATSLMHVPVYHDVPEDVRAAVARVSAEDNVTSYIVYLASLVWLLHRETGQTDISVEATFSLRPAHKAFESIQGPLTTWTLLRTKVAGCATLREAIRRVRQVVGESQENGPISDYYRLVPHTLRRAIFNYVPLPKFSATEKIAADLTAVHQRLPFARWKRPWDLHITLLDAPARAMLVWTGNEQLFTRDALVKLFERFREHLGSLQ